METKDPVGNKSDLIKLILKAVAVAGVVAIPVAGPLILMSLGEELGLGKFGGRRVGKSLSYLQKSKILEVSYKDNEAMVSLTAEGQKRLNKYNIDEIKVKKPKKWDKLWRLVFFDVPERYRPARDYLRFKLKELGFHQMQKSVWVHPYPCEDEIDYICNVYEIKPFVNVAVVQRIGKEAELKRLFRL